MKARKGRGPETVDKRRDGPSRRPRKDGASSGRAEKFLAFETDDSTVRPEEPPSFWRRLEGLSQRRSTGSSSGLTRRAFLEAAAATGFGAFIASATGAWALDALDNPLARYPDRGWEKVYSDLWKYDSTFTFLCAPNDTHNCILNGYVRQGVVTRIGPTMRYGEATDLYGNATRHGELCAGRSSRP